MVDWTDAERTSLLALCAHDLFGFQALSKLYTQYHSFQEIYQSDPRDWEHMSQKVKDGWKKQKIQTDPLTIIENLSKIGASWLTYYDEQYPVLLKEISSPPIILYYQGDLSITVTNCLAVVGTRLMSPYGKQVVADYIPQLTSVGISIVSGFQRGVDQAAHKAAITAGGKTIAVLGAGLDIEYPTNSRQLRNSLLDQNGLIFSEYPLGTFPFKANFPRRNRIVSGLSQAVLVVEAALQSGSMITPRFALEQNRDVFAIPGSVLSSLSAGPHYLIQQGAKCIASPQDILSEFFNTKVPEEEIQPQFENDLQLKIYKLLRLRPYQLDELATELKLAIDQISAELIVMDLAGIARDRGDGFYSALSARLSGF